MEAPPLKTVALHATHQQLGAKIVPFAGYAMPVRYSSDLEEHHTVRRGVGIFDVSHMGEFRLRGPRALDLIQRTTSNDASKLAPGKAQYSCLPNANGGIVDDLLVYMLGEEDYFLVVNASNIDKDWNWLQQHNTEGVPMENLSDQLSLFAVQGPKAAEALRSLTDADLAAIPYYSFVQGTFAGAPGVIISATGYTGAGGFELYVPNEHAAAVWDKIMEAGKPFGLKPIGLGARDTLRLEMGYCLYYLAARSGPGLDYQVYQRLHQQRQPQSPKGRRRAAQARGLRDGWPRRPAPQPLPPCRCPGPGHRRSDQRRAVADPQPGHWPGLRQDGVCRSRHVHFCAGARQKPARYREQAAAGARHRGGIGFTKYPHLSLRAQRSGARQSHPNDT